MGVRRIRDPEVAAAFDAYPPAFRTKLLALRKLILETAAATEGVGEIEETLGWGEPAYLTSETKSGSTIRIDWKARDPDRYAMYFHCQTGLVADFRERFGDVLHCEGNRSIVFERDEAVRTRELSACIAAALTHHREKKRRR